MKWHIFIFHHIGYIPFPIFVRYLSSHAKGECDEVEAADSSSKDSDFLAEVVQFMQLQIVGLTMLDLSITILKK